MAIHGKARSPRLHNRPDTNSATNPGRTLADRQRYVRQQQQRQQIDAPAESLGDKLLKAFGFKKTTFAANANYTDVQQASKDFASLTSTTQRRPQMSDEYLLGVINQVSPKKAR